MRRPSRIVVGVVAFLGLASPAFGGTTAWTVVPTANPGGRTVSNITFTGVSSTGLADAWAVGIDEIRGTRFPLVEHWDGSHWRAMRVPRPANRQSWFNGVVALTPTNVWAVGVSTDAQFNNQQQRTLIEHWDGSRWSIVPSPNPATLGGSGDILMGIDGVGPNDLWAAGWVFDQPNDQIRLLLEHFNGTKWTAVPSPSSPGSTHFGSAVTAVAPNDAWVVGNDALERTLAAHWNGRAWSIVPTPSPHDGAAPTTDLTGVAATAGNDVWASGYEANVDGQNFLKPYVLHWNGSEWTLTFTPNQGGEGSRLNAAVAVSAGEVWAVGQTQELDGRILTLTQRFDGITWSTLPSPSPGDPFPIDSLHGVAVAGSGGLWAVGARSTPGECCLRTLALATVGG